jgi:hypothetical protein
LVPVFVLCAGIWDFSVCSSLASGARLFKSGPIQITADGSTVWVVNTDHDSVSRIRTSDEHVDEFLLPDPGQHDGPRGLSALEDGGEVWVACHDSDRVYILLGSDGSVVGQVDMPWGSGPYSVALSRNQETALVTLHRSEQVAVVDVATRSVISLLDVFWSPMGIAWSEDGTGAWITHLFAPGEHPLLTRLDIGGADPRVTTAIQLFRANPVSSSSLAPPFDIAEGGYLTTRGHPAQIPSASGLNELWLPVQYNNINGGVYTPDSTVQASVRRLELATHTVREDARDKIVFTAVHVHETTSPNNYIGPGWNAGVAGPIDIGFSADGLTAGMLFELSNDLIVFGTSTPAVKPGGSAPLTEISVGDRPIGIAFSPTGEVAYVANLLSRDVSVVDLSGLAELRRVSVTPSTGEPLSAAILNGARLFHSSDDPRISGNEKVSCASCHVNAEHDGRTWNLQNLPGPHGPRDVQTLIGLNRTMGSVDPATGWGQLHRSGDRDEIQDFEHTFQGPQMGGSGFIGAGVNPELGASNAGLSSDLDDITAYILSLEPLLRSPARQATGILSEAAVRGATIFVGDDRAAHPADGGCAACHVPETGFVDFKFHDVGQRRDGGEQELNARSPAWHVNTATLIGTWATPLFNGISTFAEAHRVRGNLLELVKDQAARATSGTPHGTPDGLTGKQVSDLVEFLMSIDGNTLAADIRNARDVSPPRIARVEPASLDRLDVWFTESVEQADVEMTGAWLLRDDHGVAVPITNVIRHAQNGDRATLFTSLRRKTRFTLSVTGTIRDLAGNMSDGTANALNSSDAANTRTFFVGDTLRIKLGSSGYENVDVSVHDAAMVGSGLSTWSHDTVWMYQIGSGPNLNTAFLRFDWGAPFQQAAGIPSSHHILHAAILLHGDFGESQTIEARRCLQPWSDSATGGDWNSNANGAPTWRDHAHPNGRWNTSGARSLGAAGDNPADYNAGFDLASQVDAVVAMDRISGVTLIAGSAVTDAFRFWFDHPAVDYGYGLRVPGATQETRFHRSETGLGDHGPVLEIVYALGTLMELEELQQSAGLLSIPFNIVVGNSSTILLERAQAVEGPWGVDAGAVLHLDDPQPGQHRFETTEGTGGPSEFFRVVHGE